MGGEIPGAWLQQRITAGLLAPVGHQGAARALGGVVAPGLQGVVDHQQLALGHGCGALAKPGGQARVQLAAPAGRALGRGGQESEGLELGGRCRLQGRAGLQPQRELRLRTLVQRHQLLAPERPVPLDPLHRQGIEHLMGEHHTAQR